MIVTHNINLDLTSEYILGIKIPQYTKDSHKLVVTVSDNGTPKTFNTSNETVKFKANTPGEHYYYLDTTITANTITIILPKEISAYAGKVQALFEISNTVEESIQSTMKFYIVVTPSVYDEDVIVNSDIFTSLAERLAVIDGLIATANNNIATLNQLVSETETVVTQKLTAIDTQLSQKMDDVDTAVAQKMSTVDTTVQDKLDSYDTAIADKIADVNSALTDAETAIDNKLDEIDATATQRLSAFDTQVQNKLDNIDTLVQEKTAEMDALLAELDSTTASLDWLNSTDKIIDSKIVDRG